MEPRSRGIGGRDGPRPHEGKQSRVRDALLTQPHEPGSMRVSRASPPDAPSCKRGTNPCGRRFSLRHLVLRPGCPFAAWHCPSVDRIVRGRGPSLMFNKCEKLRLINRHVAESRQRLEAQEARAAELERSGGPIEDATTLLDEARLRLRLMERRRDVILWDHARGS